MAGEGIIEIDGNKFRRPREDIRKLKSILDELRIMHIIDDVMFYSTSEEAEQMNATRNAREWKFEKDGGVGLENRFCHTGPFEYRELIIPDLFVNNFTRLILLDHEQYKFLGDLFY